MAKRMTGGTLSDTRFSDTHTGNGPFRRILRGVAERPCADLSRHPPPHRQNDRVPHRIPAVLHRRTPYHIITLLS